ncbi:putative E3 ubiquitin-protein ligase HTD2 [Quaeritorhiza haematococci]|nr:putative E3 ubiquitin-protein ligase HTD2 [Quaeritorhiza haematococci]
MSIWLYLSSYCSYKGRFQSVLSQSLQHWPDKKEDAAHMFRQMIKIFQQFITLRAEEQKEDVRMGQDLPAIEAIKSLKLFYEVNEECQWVSYYEFYNESIEKLLDIKEDYPKWKTKERYPFLLGTSIKGDILRIESMIQMRHELQDSFFRALFIGVNSPYLQIEVRRGHVIRDALFQGRSRTICANNSESSLLAKKASTREEFKKLITKDMFDVSYGMFVINEESRLVWFTNDIPKDQESLDEYTLIGRLIGLALFNGVVLDVNFPLALYKKLLGYEVTLEDLKELDPQLGKGLEQLLNFDGDVEEAYQRTFQLEYVTPLGETQTFDLLPDGANIKVNERNRNDFVDLYVDFVLNVSVERPFRSFMEGFDSVMAGTALQLFRPEEVQELIIGSPTLDFEALEKVTQYDGFDKDSPVIRNFWKIVHEMSEDQKKKLLIFTTGSDRVPVGGLSKLQFIIARNGTDSVRLPTSHTCYNVLLLCDYSSEERLKDRLFRALENFDCGFFLS